MHQVKSVVVVAAVEGGEGGGGGEGGEGGLLLLSHQVLQAPDRLN